MSYFDQLRTHVVRLEEAYERRFAELERDYPHYHPLEITTDDGRSILLDALTAIVNARAALTKEEV